MSSIREEVKQSPFLHGVYQDCAVLCAWTFLFDGAESACQTEMVAWAAAELDRCNEMEEGRALLFFLTLVHIYINSYWMRIQAT